MREQTRFSVLHGIALLGLLALPSLQAAEYTAAPEVSCNPVGAGATPGSQPCLSDLLDMASDGDTIYLEGGQHDGGLSISQDNLTLRSVVGETAIVTSPPETGHAASVFTIEAGTTGVTLDRLDIRGGREYTIHIVGDSTATAGGVQLTNLNLRDAGVSVLRADAGTDFMLAWSTLSRAGLREPETGVLVDSRALSTTLRHNVFKGGYFTGVSITGGGSDALVAANYFTGPRLAALSIDAGIGESEDFAINNPAEPVAVANLEIRNNLFQYLEGSAIVLRGSTTATIINNSVEAFRSSGPVGRIQATTANGSTVDNDSVTLANNSLVFGEGSSGYAWEIGSGAVVTTDFNDNAYYWRNHSVRFDYEGMGGGLADWQAATGQADRSVEIDPQLSALDAHLSSFSPLINAGRNGGAPVADYDGELRNDGSVDIGFDEYSAAGGLTLPPDPDFAGTGVSDGSGEGLFPIPHLRAANSGGGPLGPWLVPGLLGVFLLAARSRSKR